MPKMYTVVTSLPPTLVKERNVMSIERLCKSCGKTFSQFNRMQTKCPLCSLNTFNKGKKPMRKIGPVTRKWIETRSDYFAKYKGPYYCYICGKHLDINEVQLDHIQSRVRAPQLRNELKNLAPICATDNKSKGSMSLDQYKDLLTA